MQSINLTVTTRTSANPLTINTIPVVIRPFDGGAIRPAILRGAADWVEANQETLKSFTGSGWTLTVDLDSRGEFDYLCLQRDDDVNAVSEIVEVGGDIIAVRLDDRNEVPLIEHALIECQRKDRVARALELAASTKWWELKERVGIKEDLLLC